MALREKGEFRKNAFRWREVDSLLPVQLGELIGDLTLLHLRDSSLVGAGQSQPRRLCVNVDRRKLFSPHGQFR